MLKNLISKHLRSHALAFAFLAIALISAAVAPHAQAEAAAAPKPVEVGQIAPGFTLPDPDGKDHASSALRGEKNLLLVFFRGAW